jgi:hypothetical protein
LDAANLGSLDGLDDLDQAFGRFRSAAKACLETAGHRLSAQLAQLRERSEEAQRQVRACERALAEADDDDSDDASRALMEAQEHLRTVNRWLRRAEDSAQSYRMAALRFERLMEEDLPRTQVRLRGIREEGIAYLSVQLDDDVAVSTTPRPPDSIQSVPAVVESVDTDPLVEFPLPPGFRWVSLDHISQRDDLRDDEGFPKVSEHDMRRGFGTLRRQVLPFLAQNPDANAHVFQELDGYTAVGAPKPRQKAYEAFFGDAPIVLDGPRSDGTFSVTNGRHRIKVARDMGWSAVPARVIGKPGRYQ